MWNPGTSQSEDKGNEWKMPLRYYTFHLKYFSFWNFFTLKMWLAKDEITHKKLKYAFASGKKNVVITCSSSADNFREHILGQNWIFELRCNRNKTQKSTKGGSRLDNSAFQYEA